MVRTYQSTLQCEAARKRAVVEITDPAAARWILATFHRLPSSCMYIHAGMPHVPIFHEDTSRWEVVCKRQLPNRPYLGKQHADYCNPRRRDGRKELDAPGLCLGVTTQATN